MIDPVVLENRQLLFAWDRHRRQMNIFLKSSRQYSRQFKREKGKLKRFKRRISSNLTPHRLGRRSKKLKNQEVWVSILREKLDDAKEELHNEVQRKGRVERELMRRGVHVTVEVVRNLRNYLAHAHAGEAFLWIEDYLDLGPQHQPPLDDSYFSDTSDSDSDDEEEEEEEVDHDGVEDMDRFLDVDVTGIREGEGDVGNGEGEGDAGNGEGVGEDDDVGNGDLGPIEGNGSLGDFGEGWEGDDSLPFDESGEPFDESWGMDCMNVSGFT